MAIQYLDPENRWSEATIFNNTLYYTSVPENLEGYIHQQTTSALLVKPPFAVQYKQF
ncbi:MAG: hypothetical protein ACL7AX_08615 [Candidatus Arsenophonus phytopathogenicus]